MAWKECVICGEGFDARGPQKCCDKLKCKSRLMEMKKERARSRRITIFRNCIVCGAEFRPNTTGVHCSSDCRKITNSKHQREYRLNNIEKIREKEMSPHRLEKRRHYERQRLLRNKKKVIKECVVCGTSFDRVNPNQKTCSSTCSAENVKKGYTTRNRVKYQDKPDAAVREYLKRDLGTEPPADLVEEATALRLLNRALRNV